MSTILGGYDTVDIIKSLCTANCVFKPATYPYFVATTDIKIVGTNRAVKPGDFVIAMPDRLLSYSATEFSKYFDVCYTRSEPNE